jgi:hypothetical protein
MIAPNAEELTINAGGTILGGDFRKVERALS